MERIPKDVTDMQHAVTHFELGQFASGTIEARDNQQERLEEFTQRVGGGEFHREITSGVTIPARCVDGRNISTGANPLAPNAAGGTEAIMVADDLTTKRFEAEDGSTAGAYGNVIAFLKGAQNPGYEVGGHTDSHAHEAKSGCGANDKLDDIYRYIAENGDTLRAIAGDIGVTIDDAAHVEIIANASGRIEFSPGNELFAVLEAEAKPEFVDHLDGEHNEVLAVINMRNGTTLDRDALAAEFGENYEAFNVDAWAFRDAAAAISLSDDEAAQKVAAMTYYNLATTMVLAGPKLRVTVLT